MSCKISIANSHLKTYLCKTRNYKKILQLSLTTCIPFVAANYTLKRVRTRDLKEKSLKKK